jgi:hypothetical protein
MYAVAQQVNLLHNLQQNLVNTPLTIPLVLQITLLVLPIFFVTSFVMLLSPHLPDDILARSIIVVLHDVVQGGVQCSCGGVFRSTWTPEVLMKRHICMIDLAK